jgi:RNA-binding protein
LLTGKERSILRSRGNKLEPVVHIGKEGISDKVIKQVDEALTAHELIKGRVLNNSMEDLRSAVSKLAELCSSEVVQIIGNNFLIYRKL